MFTLGIDLAAQPKTTFACRLEWTADGARVDSLRGKLDDAALVDALRDDSVVVAGVDVPFGWPTPFADLIAGGSTHSSWHADSERLRLRLTDVHCRDKAGVTPLSVSIDRLAAPAMRWRILRAVGRLTAPSIREVYPAAALALWKLPSNRYKRPAQRVAREQLLAHIRAELPIEMSEEHAALAVHSADALDALIAALVARAIAIGETEPCDPSFAELVEREGWIELPTCSLRELVPR